MKRLSEEDLGLFRGSDQYDENSTRGIFGGQLDSGQASNILGALRKSNPNQDAYNTDKLGEYEDYFSKAGDTSDPNMQMALDYARKQMTGEGPSVAQKQSDLAVANAAANARSAMAGARGGGLGAFQALKAGSAAAGQAAGQTAIARASEQTGALQQYGNLSAADVEQRRSAKSNAAKLRGSIMATQQAYDMARREYEQNYTNTLHTLYNEMNGNTPAALEGTKMQGQAAGALLQTAGQLIGGVGGKP